MLMMLMALIIMALAAQADEKEWSFGVVNQRSLTLTARYWNPILKYVSEKSGVPLTLKMAKNAPESFEMVRQGAFDFMYSNYVFAPPNVTVGYRVFARPMDKTIRGEIVTLADSPIRSLRDLEGKEVGFPSGVAFVAYVVTMDALLKAGITVKPVFSGNQEGTMGQLKAGRIIAASVNSRVMKEFARREKIRYSVLWASQEYLGIPLSAHPRVPGKTIEAVRRAFTAMAEDPEGLKILKSSASIIGQEPPLGFVPATDREYEKQRSFYRRTVLKEFTQ
jgi:phosphonate transport system substrate-binding protein